MMKILNSTSAFKKMQSFSQSKANGILNHKPHFSYLIIYQKKAKETRKRNGQIAKINLVFVSQTQRSVYSVNLPGLEFKCTEASAPQNQQTENINRAFFFSPTGDEERARKQSGK